MPRNASGIYTLPEPPVVNGTVIDPVDENSTRDDMAAEITNSLDRAGRGGMTAAFKIFDGSQATPGMGFTADPDNGIWRNGANDWSLGAGNTEILRFTANTMVLPATATFSALGTLSIGSLATAAISPAQIVANTNDYAPAGFTTASMIRLSTDASRNITGLAGGTVGRLVLIHNVGAFNIVLTDEDVLSAAANRFAMTGILTLTPDTAVLLQYDLASLRWRLVSAPPANSIIDAKGDLLVGTAADSLTRKAVGANGTMLVADSTQGDGLLWIPPYATVAAHATTMNLWAARENELSGGAVTVTDIVDAPYVGAVTWVKMNAAHVWTHGAGVFDIQGNQTFTSAVGDWLRIEAQGVSTFNITIFKKNAGALNGQIPFPATQNASANANTLDDYEEGSWTMTLAFGGASAGITYTTQTGSYTKIGNRVLINGILTISSKGSSVGGATVNGLPFSASGLSAIPNRINTLGAVLNGVPMFYANGPSITCQHLPNTGTGVNNLTDTNFANTTDIIVGGAYPV